MNALKSLKWTQCYRVCFELLRSGTFYSFSQRMTARSLFSFLLLITVPLITAVWVRERGREIAWDIVFVWRQKNAVWLIAFGCLWCNVSAGRLSAQSWGAQYMQTHNLSLSLSFPATVSACLSLLVSVFIERAAFSLRHRGRSRNDLLSTVCWHLSPISTHTWLRFPNCTLSLCSKSMYFTSEVLLSAWLGLMLNYFKKIAYVHYHLKVWARIISYAQQVCFNFYICFLKKVKV